MIAYVDSSVLTRSYLADEVDHRDAVDLLAGDLELVTGTWTELEVSGSLVRAAQAGRGDRDGLLDALAADLDPSAGRVAVLSPPQEKIKVGALELVLEHGLRAMDALHLACAGYLLPAISDSGEPTAFATRDERQRDVALRLGFAAV